jgi:hypothetical protein
LTANRLLHCVHFLLLGEVGSAVFGVDGSSFIPTLLSSGDVACILVIKLWFGEAIRVFYSLLYLIVDAPFFEITDSRKEDEEPGE